MKTNITKTDFKANQKEESGKPGTKDNQPPKNKIAVRTDIRMIWPYSAKKNKAKTIAEYSTLKPETNSDSPSAKSKGALLVSAKAETKNIIKAGKRGKIK